MKKLSHFNPVVAEVIDTFSAVEFWANTFTNKENPSARRGLLISGDAGMGKTHFVTKGVNQNVNNDDIVIVKGTSITAAGLFLKLWETREQGKVLVLDDVDLVHRSSQERSTILDLLKGAAEMTKGERMLSWPRMNPPSVLVELGADKPFDYQGSIIWITNDTIDGLSKATKSHWPAISSRFTQVNAWFDLHQKLQYTLYLITEQDILGKNCMVKEGGYSEEIQQLTIDYIRNNYQDLSELTPRAAIGIADTILMAPTNWELIVEQSLLNL